MNSHASTTAGAPPSLDLSRLIEAQKPGRFIAGLLLVCALMMLTEGYDLGAMSFAAPSLAREWQLNRGAFGPVFGAFVIGTAIGAIVLGHVGDAIGRKRTMVWCGIAVSLLTFATMWAQSVPHLIVLRLLAGIGVGGVLPNVMSYVTEFVPKRWRATSVTLVYTGYAIGTGAGGVVAAWLIPHFGWQSVFFIGGVGPLLGALALWRLPESPRFLVLRKREPGTVARIAERLQPGLRVAPDTQFSMTDEPSTHASTREIFTGRLRLVTPTLWLVYIANSMALFFLISWLPMLIESVGVAPERAALVSLVFSIGGTIGGLALMRFVDRHGALVITVLPLVGFPLVAVMGVPMPELALTAVAFAVGFCVVGTQFGLNAVAAMVYPTALRSKGVGAAIGVQKIGAFAGPVIAGALLSAQLSVQQLFMFGAAPVFIVMLLSFALGRACRRSGVDGSGSITADTPPTLAANRTPLPTNTTI
ncbi:MULTISPECIES: MFS transporter [unclassified Acidovorax]|uniref:MFS transporter n=1 Tax=unclassified Acidovorax TaxID=2684926 RepID=UPI002882E2C6|nr:MULTISPECIES: MFS transporter [unclassified Acidovorax]